MNAFYIIVNSGRSSAWIFMNIHKDKDKDKETLFNVAYHVTDNISSWAILQHNSYIFNRRKETVK